MPLLILDRQHIVSGPISVAAPFTIASSHEAVALIGEWTRLPMLFSGWNKTTQSMNASQLEVEDRVQTKWTEKDLRERAGALRSAHGSAAEALGFQNLFKLF